MLNPALINNGLEFKVKSVLELKAKIKVKDLNLVNENNN